MVVGTSLTPAWWWTIPAMLVWSASTIIGENAGGTLDYLAYASVVLMLAPFVAVLGARRPGVGAWNWFVVLPMIVVLQWPAVSAVAMGSIRESFVLPQPMSFGVGLVMVMGLGNYFGTRFTAPVLLFGVGPAIILRSLVLPGMKRSPEIADCVIYANIAIAAAAVVFLVRSRPAVHAAERALERRQQLDSIWHDFQQLFGVVWSKRLMDRLNQFAQRENWSGTFGLDGFQLRDGETSIDDAAVSRIRWVLRRFVDPEWLDKRLHDTGPPADAGEPQES